MVEHSTRVYASFCFFMVVSRKSAMLTAEINRKQSKKAARSYRTARHVLRSLMTRNGLLTAASSVRAHHHGSQAQQRARGRLRHVHEANVVNINGDRCQHVLTNVELKRRRHSQIIWVDWAEDLIE